jgi:hypothetical protein
MRKLIVTTLATALIAAAAAQPALAKHRTAPAQKPAQASQPASAVVTAPVQQDYSRYQNGAMSAPAGR